VHRFVLAIILALGAAAYEATASRHDVHAYPPPGHLVDAAGFCRPLQMPLAVRVSDQSNDITPYWIGSQRRLAALNFVGRMAIAWVSRHYIDWENHRLVAGTARVIIAKVRSQSQGDALPDISPLPLPTMEMPPPAKVVPAVACLNARIAN
jgi:hypothetical protein